MPRLSCAAVCLLSLLLSAGTARSEVERVRIAQGFGIGYLPQLVMQKQELLQKHARESGLPPLRVEWLQLGSGVAMNDALLSGNLDFGSGGVAPMLQIWDKTKRTIRVKGVAALCSLNNFLNTTRPDLRSVKDFQPTDRIAVPAGGVHHLILRMAAEQAFGPGQQNRLDSLVASLAHPDGYRAMLTNSVDANFTSFPFQTLELANPAVHRVTTSYDVLGGPATFLVVWSTDTFRSANPKVYGAYLGALEEAVAWINANHHAAAELYAASENDGSTVGAIETMLAGSDVAFTTTPQRVMMFAAFMQRVGMIKELPGDWRTMFHPEIAGKDGS